MFLHTVTVYNKYLLNGVEKWQRTVIPGVFWNAIRGVQIRKGGDKSADKVQLLIPFSAAASRSYKKPKEWLTLSDKTSAWTLQEGDTIIKGNIVYEITVSTKELQNFDDAAQITAVDTKDTAGPMSHWEVIGK